MSSPKVMSAADAAKLVRSGDTVLVNSAGGGVNEPDCVLRALESRFLTDGSPGDLHVVSPNGLGDGMGSGLERFSAPGMARRVVAGHWGWSRALQQLARAGEIEAFCLPQGVLSHMLRAIAGGRPGHVTHIGLDTFVDPRADGGTMNARTPRDMVELIEIAGEEWLLYKSFPIDVTIIRGTLADEWGNLTMDDEGVYCETLSAAQAAKNSGGIVIAQAARLVQRGSVDARRVKVPGTIVNAVVIDPDQRTSLEFARDPSLTCGIKVPNDSLEPMPLNLRKVIARRATMELHEGDVVNLGYGVPDGVAAVLTEEGQVNRVTLTVEQGHYGGIPALGPSFGLSRNQEAIIDQGYQFDFYDGGGLDIAVLSFAEFDKHGNVNVSKFGDRLTGLGGFLNIAQGAKRVVFAGTFFARAAAPELIDGTLHVCAQGTTQKLVKNVEQVSFSGARAQRLGREVTYVTERAVFQLRPGGVTLTEIAPGLDVERDVLAYMGFEPEIAPDLKAMDERLFRNAPLRRVLGAKR